MEYAILGYLNHVDGDDEMGSDSLFTYLTPAGPIEVCTRYKAAQPRAKPAEKTKKHQMLPILLRNLSCLTSEDIRIDDDPGQYWEERGRWHSKHNATVYHSTVLIRLLTRKTNPRKSVDDPLKASFTFIVMLY